MSQSAASPADTLVEQLAQGLAQALVYAGRSSGDMFLAVKGTRQGALSGEASAPGFEGQIMVNGWRWGMMSGDALPGKSGAARAAKALTVFKAIDSASTQLMSALCTREKLSEVKLSMRRGGDGQAAFMEIKLKNALVVTLDVQGTPDGTLLEQVSFQFNAVEVSYSGQAGSGQNRAGRVFTTDFGPDRD